MTADRIDPTFDAIIRRADRYRGHAQRCRALYIATNERADYHLAAAEAEGASRAQGDYHMAEADLLIDRAERVASWIQFWTQLSLAELARAAAMLRPS